MAADLPRSLRARAAVERGALSLLLGSPRLTALLARGRSAPVDGRTLDPQVAAMLALSDLVTTQDRSHPRPAAARREMEAEILVVEAPVPPGVRTEDRRLPGPAGPILVRLYTPAGLAAPSPAVVYFHGGGWVTGSLESHDPLCRRLAVGAFCRVVAVDYRLAPEHPFPAAVDDALAAFRSVAGGAVELGIDAARVAVAGDSAGGNLAAVVSLKTRDDARPPALQVLVYPATDATFGLPSHATLGEGYFLTRSRMDWYLGHYAGDGEKRHPDLSPLFAEDVRGVAPALVYTAGFDPLRDEGRAYADRLAAAGVGVTYREHASLFHGFANATLLTAARRAVQEIATEVGRALRRSPSGSAPGALRAPLQERLHSAGKSV